MRTIYIVSEHEPYENSYEIRAFFSKKRAEKFAERIDKYNKKYPVFDPDEDDDWYEYQFFGLAVKGETWEEFDKRMELWRSKHPAGKNNSQCLGGTSCEVCVFSIKLDNRE